MASAGKIAVLQENLERIQDLNAVMRQMAQLDRCPVSESCNRIVSFMHEQEDPLLYPAQFQTTSPFMKKTKKKKRFLCF